MNEPYEAWLLQVYLRDFGLYLWLAPSIEIYGGFAARIEKYDFFAGYVFIASAADNLIQHAARKAIEQIEFDMSGFDAWRIEWELTHTVETT